MMAVVSDSTSLPGTGQVSLADGLLMAQLKISLSSEVILDDLDEWEAASIVFLSLPRHYLTHHGHKLCQYIRTARISTALSEVVSVLSSEETGGLSALVEALYATGRHDILHLHLGITVNAALKKNYQSHSSLEPDRRALYCVFSGMAQEQTDQLLNDRLSSWSFDEGRPLEETFVRNLTPSNYTNLLTQLYEALNPSNPTLANFLTPHIVCEPCSPMEPQPMDPRPQEPSRDAFGSERLDLDTYPLPSCFPHGLCIIINVKTFIEPSVAHDQIPLSVRHGSEVDCERLSATFKMFGFHVNVYIDPDRHKVESIFKSLRTDARLALVSCLVVCIMTHGDEYDNLYLHDRSSISLTDVRKLCFSSVLINKPRLFFIQACRGEQALRPIFLQRDVCSVAHAESDCLISAATIQGYTAVRSQTEGSWYVSEICGALQECGHHVPVRTALQRARAALKDRVGTMAGGFVTQLSEDKVTLTKYVQLVRAEEQYFLEGIMDLTRMEMLEQLLDEAVEEVLEEEISRR